MGGYSDGSNTWPAVGGIDPVGKYYGARVEGNVAGVTCATSGEGRMVWEFDVDDYTVAEGKTLQIPDGYARITSIMYETEVAFTTATVDVTVGGTTTLTAATDIKALGMVEGSLTATPANLTIDSGEDVAIDITLTGATGKAKVIVEFTRV